MDWIEKEAFQAEKFEVVLVTNGYFVIPAYLSDYEDELETKPVYSEFRSDLTLSDVTHCFRFPKPPSEIHQIENTEKR